MTNRKQGAAAARDALRHFRVVFSSIKRHFRAVEARCGVGGSELWALTDIARTPGLRVADLASALLIHQSTASNLVDGLVQSGHVMKRRSTSDQRVVHLFPTAKGRKLLERAPAPTEGILPHAISRLRPAELAKLNEALRALVDAIAVHDDKAASTPLADL